jgi:acetolactate decarboxylase
MQRWGKDEGSIDMVQAGCEYHALRSAMDTQALKAIIRLSALFALAAFGLFGPAHAGPDRASACTEAGPLTVHVVRHAEREEDGGDDPGLSLAGRMRAHALADALAASTIDTVYVTSLRRTSETAAPLIARQQPEVHTWPIERGQAEQHVRSLVETVCRQHVDQTLLVVGHSNTVAQIVAMLSGHPETTISEREYDHLYQVRLNPGHSGQVLRVRFGAPNRPSFKVAWEGALRNFHHGDVRGRVNLDHFAGRPNVIAVGPVGELDGEVTALDGRWYITQVHDGEAVTAATPGVHAGFLVWADVPAWQEPITINNAIADQRELELLVAELAEAAGLDTDSPFPFRIQARADALDWHVLAPPPDDQSHGGHLDFALKRSLKQTDIELVGFFSRHHAGVFNHRNSWTHIHVILPNGHAGHVDALGLKAGARLLLPR